MRTVLVFLLACLVHVQAEEGSGTERRPATTSAAGEAAPKGDRVVLRSGLSLWGLKVLSESSIDVRVEVLPGEEPLILPAGQVVDVVYGPDHAAGSQDGPASEEESNAPEPELLPAHKMSPSFSRKLAKAVSGQIEVYTDRDIVTLLEAMASEHRITIQVGEGIRSLPADRRSVTLAVTPEQSVEEFLRRVLTEAAPWLRVDTQFDEVIVSLRPGVQRKE